MSAENAIQGFEILRDQFNKMGTRKRADAAAAQEKAGREQIAQAISGAPEGMTTAGKTAAMSIALGLDKPSKFNSVLMPDANKLIMSLGAAGLRDPNAREAFPQVLKIQETMLYAQARAQARAKSYGEASSGDGGNASTKPKDYVAPTIALGNVAARLDELNKKYGIKGDQPPLKQLIDKNSSAFTFGAEDEVAGRNKFLEYEKEKDAVILDQLGKDPVLGSEEFYAERQQLAETLGQKVSIQGLKSIMGTDIRDDNGKVTGKASEAIYKDNSFQISKVKTLKVLNKLRKKKEQERDNGGSSASAVDTNPAMISADDLYEQSAKDYLGGTDEKRKTKSIGRRPFNTAQ